MATSSASTPHPEPQIDADESQAKRPPGGGAATGGGINFQAAITAIAGVHLLRGTPIRWLEHLTDDTPIAVWAETNGPGDDIRLELANGKAVEIQAKKGLQRGEELWTPLLAMATALANNQIDFGLLAVAPDSSGTIRADLAKDIQRLADGRQDDLSEIGREWLARLNRLGFPANEVCARLRIRVVHALEADCGEITSAIEVLRYMCANEDDATNAWNALYRNAVAIIERRGRWCLQQLMALLAVSKIDVRDGRFPASIANRLANWAIASNATFEIAGLNKRLPITALLPQQTIAIPFERYHAEHAAMALARYQTFGQRQSSRDDSIFDAEWTGRFYPKAVVVAGPGLGKSTLITRLAYTYAADNYVVAKVSLKSVAAAMRRGQSFEDSVFQLGFDGAGVLPSDIRQVGSKDLILLADGLDECGDQHHQVAAGLVRIVNGYPSLTVVVTTRPIGYESTELAAWRHYYLCPPKPEDQKTNLSALLVAGSDGNFDRGSAEEVASRELAATAAASTIAASPHMLGMAASLIIQKGNLPQSRTQLYARMITLLENSPRKPTLQTGQSTTVAARVLNIVGWTIIHDPLSDERKVVQSCCEAIAPELNVSVLMASIYVEPALSYWLEAGLIEKIFHNGITLLSFIHKSFAEFAAARYLISLPDDARAHEFQRIIDDASWAEVTSFATGLGCGDEIAAILAARRSKGQPGQLERALALISNPDADISDSYAVSIINEAFQAAEDRSDDCLALGVAIADLASKRPDLVLPIADSHLYANNPTVQLIAWAAVASGGNGNFDQKEAMAALSALLPHVGASFAPSLLGGFRVGSDHGRDLIQRLAYAILVNMSLERLTEFVERELAHQIFQNMGFVSKIDALLVAKGASPSHMPRWMRGPLDSTVNFARAVATRSHLGRDAIRALAEILMQVSEEAPSREAHHFLQLSALLRATSFYEVPVYDLEAWTEDFDRAAVSETLRVFTAINAIDPSTLAAEAAYLVQRLDQEPELTPFSIPFPLVDIPEPSWIEVMSTRPDQELLARALNHRSIWVTLLAGRILEQIPIEETKLISLLGETSGDGLAAVVSMVCVRVPNRAAKLLLDRMEGEWVDGFHILFDALKKLHPPLTDRLRNILVRGLTASSVRIAESATALAADLVDRGLMTDPAPIEKAYEHWERYEEPSPQYGIIPRSPREGMIRILLALGAITVDWLIGRLGDPRSDVRSLIGKQISELAAVSSEVSAKLVEAIVAHTVPAGFAARTLSGEMRLSSEQVSSLAALLGDTDPKWRLAGMSLLRSTAISDPDIMAHATRLLEDTEAEIRQRAQRILRDLSDAHARA